MKHPQKEFPGLQTFLFDFPLYEQVLLPITDQQKSSVQTDPLDGFCAECGRLSMFKRRNRYEWDEAVQYRKTGELTFSCARSEQHLLRFTVLAGKGTIQKIGQYPTFATIAQGTIKELRSTLDPLDASELHKAMGLAAHEVGIGSFVYMRRIFERTIEKRFHEFKEGEAWDEAGFRQMAMDEKIDLLRNHLPEFLKKNRRLYSILSLGIHQLDEKECLAFFEVAKASIIFILDEDRRKKEELAERTAAERAIAAYHVTN